MAHRDTEDHSPISLCLMEILHQIGNNKKIRSRRKNVCLETEELKSFMDIKVEMREETTFSLQIFGSQIEGSTTPGLQSDIDAVSIYLPFLAIRNIDNAISGYGRFLMVSEEHTFPGYFKLQCLKTTLDGLQPMKEGDMELNSLFSVDCEGHIVLKASNIVRYAGNARNGPAVTVTRGVIKSDGIWGMRVNSWVKEAIPWLERHKQCTWISPNDFQYFLMKKAFLVPVGHPLSQEKELEWRISFTEVERELMWKLNDTQMACFILMKIINKFFITPSIGECLSSYHCKTAMFYLLDNTAKEFWKPTNLLVCLKLLLKTICAWVKEGFCPNYFIPEENMFLGKMTGPVRQQLYHILNILIDMEFKYLLLVECDHLGQALSDACSRLSTLQETPSDIKHLVQVRQDKTSVFSNYSLHIVDTLSDCYMWLLKLSSQKASLDLMLTLISGFQAGSRYLKGNLLVLMAFLSSHIGCQLVSSCLASQNHHSDDIDKARKFLLHGTRSDVTSGKLKLAGFYLKMGYPGYPSLAEAVLSDVDKELVHHVSEVSAQVINWFQPLKEITREKIISEDLKTTEVFQKYLAVCVIYLPSEIHVTLPPLCYEMFRSVGADPALRDSEKHYWYDWAVVEARPYLYFLQYQTYVALGKDGCRQMALKNLLRSLKDKRTIFTDTGLNLLAYCFRQEGELELAWLALSVSLRIKPEHNAAIWQIIDLLHQQYQSLEQKAALTELGA